MHETANIQEGARLAKILGCYDGCHGSGVSGQDFFGMYAPDLSRKASAYSDEQMEQVIRQGIRPDGTSVFLMPSVSFQHLSDEDLGHIIAFLRSQPLPSGDPLPRTIPLQTRYRMLTGALWPSAPQVDGETPPLRADRSSPEVFGRYLVYSTCVECHGENLRGYESFSPNLIVASGYNQHEFRMLMQEGAAIGGRDIGLMGRVARSRFSLFTDEELNAIHSYLNSESFIESAFDE